MGRGGGGGHVATGRRHSYIFHVNELDMQNLKGTEEGVDHTCEGAERDWCRSITWKARELWNCEAEL